MMSQLYQRATGQAKQAPGKNTLLMKLFPAEHKDIAMDLGQPVSLAVLMLLHEYMNWVHAGVTDCSPAAPAAGLRVVRTEQKGEI